MNKIILLGMGAVAVVLVSWYVYLDLAPSDEEVRMAMIDEFREHEIYKKFKSMYPNSTESYALYERPALEVKQSDNHNNTLSLMILKGDDIHPYYSVICSTDRWLKPQGVPFEATFDFLDDNDCLQD